MVINDYRTLFFYTGLTNVRLSGGNWLGGSLNNLLEPRLERIARSADLAPSSTQFNIELKTPTEIAGLYLGWTNLTAAATVEVQFWPDATFDGPPDFDPGPAQVIPNDPDPDRRLSAYYVLDHTRTTQFISVKIVDTANPAGYIDISLLHVGPFLKAPINFGDGNALSFVANALVAQDMNGDDVILDRAERRNLRLPFGITDSSDIYGDIFAMVRSVKSGNDIIVIPDPTADLVTMQRTSFLGRAVNRDPLSLLATVPGAGSWGVEVRERLGPKPEVRAAVFRIELGAGAFGFTFRDANLVNQQAAGLLTGMFTLTGGDLGFHRALHMALGAGAFGVTGGSLNLRHASILQLGAGSFELTGEPVALARHLRLALAAGTFALTGGAVDLIVRRMQMGTGVFALTGKSLAFRRALRMGLGTGTFVLTGGDVEMSSGIRLQMGTGAFVLSGQPVRLSSARIMGLGQGSFAFTGGDLRMPVRMPLDGGEFIVTGGSAELKAARRMMLGGGSFAATGGDLGLTHQAHMSLGTGVFAVTGGSVDLRNYHLRVGAGDQAGKVRVLAGDAAGNRRRTTN